MKNIKIIILLTLLSIVGLKAQNNNEYIRLNQLSLYHNTFTNANFIQNMDTELDMYVENKSLRIYNSGVLVNDYVIMDTEQVVVNNNVYKSLNYIDLLDHMTGNITFIVEHSEKEVDVMITNNTNSYIYLFKTNIKNK